MPPILTRGRFRVTHSALWDIEVGGKPRLGLEDGNLPGFEAEPSADPRFLG